MTLNGDRLEWIQVIWDNQELASDLLRDQEPADLSINQMDQILYKGRRSFFTGCYRNTSLNDLTKFMTALGVLRGASVQLAEDYAQTWMTCTDEELEHLKVGGVLNKTTYLRSIWEMMEQPPLEFLIDGVLMSTGSNVLYGKYGSGKSFVALDMALSIQAGISCGFLPGSEVKQGNVVYWPLEGYSGMPNRFRAWSAAHPDVTKEQMDGFTYVDDSFIFMRHGSAKGAMDLVTKIKKWTYTSPCLVIIDTLAHLMAGKNENAVQDMAEVCQGLSMIRSNLGCATLLIHHCNKAGEMRGSTSLPGENDVIMKTVLDGAGPHCLLQCEKIKDGYPVFDDKKFLLVPTKTQGMPEKLSSCYVSEPMNSEEALLIHGMKFDKKYTSEAVARMIPGKGAAKTKTNKANECLKRLVDRGLVEKEGKTKGAVYKKRKLPEGLGQLPAEERKVETRM